MNNVIEGDTGEVMLESLEVNGELHSAHRKSNQVCYLMIFFMITFFLYTNEIVYITIYLFIYLFIY